MKITKRGLKIDIELDIPVKQDGVIKRIGGTRKVTKRYDLFDTPSSDYVIKLLKLVYEAGVHEGASNPYC